MIALLLALACGVERQPVKVLADPAARGLHRLEPEFTTIADLRAIPPPSRWTGSLARLPAEKHVVSVESWIVGYKLEADSDVHVVLRDARGLTIVNEYPAGGCTTRSYAPGLQAEALAALLRILPSKPTSKYRAIPAASQPHVRVTGPQFLDKIHGQTGVAPNGIEIHATLRIEAIP